MGWTSGRRQLKLFIKMRKVFLLVFFAALLFVVFYFGIIKRDARKGLIISPFSKEERISALIVPHFGYADAKREKFLATVSQKITPSKIVIISVNHFLSGDNDIITSTREWNFKNGSPIIDKQLASKIIDQKNVFEEDAPFIGEHGISETLPDLLSIFPNASYLPVIIKNTAPREKVSAFIDNLAAVCRECLLVASIDLSHYCPVSLASIHDKKTLTAINTFDENGGWEAETDSPQTLFSVIRWAKNRGSNSFVAIDYGFPKKAGEDGEITSFILGYYRFSGSKKANDDRDKQSTFLFGGDAMFGRYVYEKYPKNNLNLIFSKLGERFFWGADISLINLEGPVTTQPKAASLSPDNLVFNFYPEVVWVLKNAHISAVSLANNHTMNAGLSGFEETKKLLAVAGVKAVGGSSGNQVDVLRINLDIPMSVIAVNLLNGDLDKSMEAAISTEDGAGRFVIIYPHWGVEYEKKHSKSQELAAHSWVDAGADMIVGSHPHVVQDFEIYKNRPIFYSLGNLVFDQFFSLETQKGLVVGGIVDERGLEISFFPVRLVDLIPYLEIGQERTALIEELLGGANGFVRINRDTIFIPF